MRTLKPKTRQPPKGKLAMPLREPLGNAQLRLCPLLFHLRLLPPE